MNEYIRQMDCELMQVGGLLDAKGQYGFITVSGIFWKDAQLRTHRCYNISHFKLQVMELGPRVIPLTATW